MLSQSSKYLIICICSLIVQALGNSDVNTIKNVGIDTDLNKLNHDINNVDNPKNKSQDMPASVVLLLLCIFISLGLVCIRHIKREWTQQQQYLIGKRGGQIFSSTGIATKSYGSTINPHNLNEDNIDEYIDDSLYGNSQIVNTLMQYSLAIQQRITQYLERTPEPVLFEVNPDKSVEAYCKNPEIPSNPKYVAKPFKHSEHYQATPPPALQRMFQKNYQKNREARGLTIDESSKDNKTEDKEYKDEYDEIKDDIQETINQMTKKRRKVGGFPVKGGNDVCGDNDNKNKKKMGRISLRNQFGTKCNDFDDYDYATIGGGGYDAIPDNDNNNDNGNNGYDAYSDSDKNLSDSDHGNYQNTKKNKNDPTKMLTKVVVLDLD